MGKIMSTVMALTVAASSAISFSAPAEARRGDRYNNYNYCDHNPRSRDCRGYYNRYDDRRDYRRRRNNDGDVAAAAIIGLAVGAIVGGAISNDNRNDRRYYRGDSHQQRCAQRYRSYDYRTDTFVGRDGRRYYCQL